MTMKPQMSGLSAPDLAVLMQDPAFWQRIAPGMNTQGTAIGPTFDVHPRALDHAMNEIRSIGYSQIDGVLPIDELNEVLGAVRSVRQAGLSPVYSFAFDEAWGLFMRMSAIWSKILGDDWTFMPAFWTWWVEPGPANAGWPPHRDRGRQTAVRPDGTPMSLTAWIPLTPSTPSNGCLYMLPWRADSETIDIRDLQHVRALPAAPGTVLLWNQNVWHWSGHSSRRARNPRVSMAVEMQTASVPPFQAPLIDPLGCPPALSARLGLVAQQVLQYRHFTQIDGPPVELAQALLEHA